MDGSIIESDRGELEISGEERSLNLFRSMYYQMNAKPDSMSKVFAKNVIITRDDIVELNERVNKKIRMHYQSDGYIATITVSLTNREVINFECWEEFVAYEWVESNCINSIILKWNFNIRMPQYEYPQNHVLMVKLSNGLRPEEMLNFIFSGKVEDFEEIETNAFPVAARVDFIEPILGDELLNIVSEWIRGLHENMEDKNMLVLLLRKYRKKVAQYFNYVALLMIALLGMSIINNMIRNFQTDIISELSTSQFLFFFNAVVIFTFILIGASRLLNVLAHIIYEYLSQYGQGITFAITKGDKKRQEELKKMDQKKAKKIILNLIFSLIFNVFRLSN